MSIEIRDVQQVKVIDIHGKLTFDQGARELRSTVEELAQKGKCDVLLNLSDVGFMDSIGLEALLISYHAIAKCGGQIRFSNLSDKNHHLLEITKLLNVLKTYEDEEQALSSF